MMLDFQKRKKKYFDITLHDGTKLKLPTPKMAVFGAMKEVAENSSDVDEEQLSSLVLTILQTNQQKTEITEENIKEFDFDDLREFFVEYLKFVQTIMSDPNSKSPIAR
jgi:hypothetical protein